MVGLLALALVLLGRQILLGGTFYNDDILLQSIPVYAWYSEALAHGEIPIWSPAVLGGFPLAFGQYGFFYPPDMLLFRLLDSTRAFHLSLALHLALAGWACYWYCRVLGLGRLPSLFAAVVFQMGNEVVAWPANGFITKTLFVLPALLASVELMFRRGARYWVLVPAVVGASLLVGYAQIVLFGLVLAAAYAIVIALADRGALNDKNVAVKSLGTPQTPPEGGRPPLDSPSGGGLLSPDPGGSPPRLREEPGEMYVPSFPLPSQRERVWVRVGPAASWAWLRAKGAWRRQFGLFALLGVGVALGFGLAAVRVAPTLAVTALSTRSGGMDFSRATTDSIQPWALVVGYLLPAVFELPGRAATRPDFLAAPALFLAALALPCTRKLGSRALFHVGVVGVTTLLSLGSSTPFFGLLLRLPFFSYFRGPGRFTLVAALSIAVLAAYALDRRLIAHLSAHGRQYRAVLVLAVLASLAVVVGFAVSVLWRIDGGPLVARFDALSAAGGWQLLSALRPSVAVPLLGLALTPILMLACARRRIPHRLVEGSFLLLTAGTLFLLGWVQNPWLPPQPLLEPPALLDALRKDPGLFRVFSWAPRLNTYNVGAFYVGVVGYPPSVEFDERYLRQFIPPNLGMLYGVATEDGYEALQSRRQSILAYYIGSERVDEARFSDGALPDWDLHNWRINNRLNLLAALNVGYVMHPFPLDDPRVELVDEVEVQIYPNLPAVARVYLYRVKAAVPRAYAVPKAQVMSGEKDVLDTLVSGRVDPRQTVLLETPPPDLAGNPLTVGGSQVEILEYADDHVELRARSDGTGYLVLMDAPMPGWSATVDGRPEEILAADFAGRAVPLRGPGEHIVSFRYQAPLLREGVVVSLASLGVLAALLLALAVRAHGPLRRTVRRGPRG